MTLSLYRADSGKDRVMRDGFKPRCTLGITEIRDLIRVMTGVIALQDADEALRNRIPTTFALDKDQGFANSFQIKNNRPPTAEEINAYDLTRTNRDPMVLMSWVVSSGSGIMPHVSLAKTDDCGGYASKDRYIFKAELANVSERDWATAAGVTKTKTSHWPKLWMDTASLDTAKVIAIEQAQSAKEVTIFTAVSKENVKIIKEPVAPKLVTTTGGASTGVPTCICGAQPGNAIKLKQHQMTCAKHRAGK